MKADRNSINAQNRRKRRGKCQGGGQLLRLKAILAHEQMGIIKPVVTLAGNWKVPNLRRERFWSRICCWGFFLTSCCEAEVSKLARGVILSDVLPLFAHVLLPAPLQLSVSRRGKGENSLEVNISIYEVGINLECFHLPILELWEKK